jgi:hypothetical protein
MQVTISENKVEVDLTDATDLQKQYWTLMSQLIQNGLENPLVAMNLLCTMCTGLTLNEITTKDKVTISTVLASMHFLLHLGGGPKITDLMSDLSGPESSGGTLDDFFKNMGGDNGDK